MTEDEFYDFIDNCIEELEQKQDVLKNEYGIGSMNRWWFEQTTGNLQFFDNEDNLKIETDVIDIGSYSPISNTWKWAWSNDSVLPWLRQRAEKLKELETITDMGLFGDENTFELDDESMAWELAAMCVSHLGALGCYRAPSSKSNGPTSFLAIMAINKVSRK